MEVIKYNSNGFPMYWIVTGKDDMWYLKLVKRIDKNSSQLLTKIPSHLTNKVNEVRNKLINV
jgi:hypothetical protein